MAGSVSFSKASDGQHGSHYPQTLTVSYDNYDVSNNRTYVRIVYQRSTDNQSSYYNYGYANPSQISIDGSQVASATPYSAHRTQVTQTLCSWEGYIYHNNDGTKSINVSASFSSSSPNLSSGSVSGTVQLPTIPREAKITSASNFNDEGNPTMNFSKPAGFSMNVWLEPNPNGTHLCIRENISNTGTYTWNLTETERNQLRQACSGNSCTIRYGIYTNINGTQYASYVDKTMTIVNGNPTFTSSDVIYQDIDSSIVAITGDNQKIVRNNSNLAVRIAEATANKYASISKYEVTFNGETQTLNASSVSGYCAINYGTVNISQDTTLSVKVIDSRGNYTTVNKTITILDWVLPSAVLSVKRLNNYEDNTKIKVQTTISSVDNKNAITSIKYRYKRTTDASYPTPASYTTINDNTEYEIVLNKLYSFDFQFVIQDKFGTKTYNLTLAKGIPIMFIDVLLKSVGINCFPTKENALEVEGYDFTEIHPVNSVLVTSTNVNPMSSTSGTWVLLTTQTINNVTLYYWNRTE